MLDCTSRNMILVGKMYVKMVSLTRSGSTLFGPGEDTSYLYTLSSMAYLLNMADNHKYVITVVFNVVYITADPHFIKFGIMPNPNLTYTFESLVAVSQSYVFSRAITTQTTFRLA